MLETTLKKNDQRAHWLIWIFSAIVFAAVVILDQIELPIELGFNPHIFAQLSALVNTAVSILLIWAFIEVKRKNYKQHKSIMLLTMGLSVLFLVFYILHHLFTGETKYGDIDHNGILSADEQTLAGMSRYVYYFIISTHITLAGLVMPFVLYSAYRGLTADYALHKKLVRYTFPIWLYVSITGVIVYLMISSYYLP